jgi:putative intracellular protease/amidase
MPTAAIVIHDNYTDCEFLVAYHFLLAEGFDVDVYSINGGPVTGVKGWVHKTSKKLPNLHPKWDPPLECDLLIGIGGIKSIEYLRQHEGLLEWVRRHDAQDKILGSICHFASVLISAKIVESRCVLGYDSIRVDLENANAYWSDSPVAFDDNLISARHYDQSGIWAKAIVDTWKERQRKKL